MGERPVPRPGVDPLLTDDDLDEILAWFAMKDDQCPGCGQPKSESFHPDNEQAYTSRRLRCHACAARDADSTAYGGNRDGLYFAAVRDEEDG